MSTTDPLFVVAYDYKAFRAWCEGKGLNPDAKGLIYVRDAQRLMGQRDIRILFLYGWMEREDARQIYNRAIIVGRRPK